MGEKQLVSFSLVFLALAVAVFTSQARAVDLCSRAENVPLCQSVVKGESDPSPALKAAIGHLTLETEEAMKSIGQLHAANYMNVCKELMDSAIWALQDTIKSLKINDKDSVNVHLSASLAYYSQCDDAVIEMHAEKVVPSVIKTDARLMQLASNCLQLSTLIKYGEFHEEDLY